MRVLYYAPEYHVQYGARTHAREFFAALTGLPEIESATVFPPAPAEAAQPQRGSTPHRTLRTRWAPGTLRRMARLLYPGQVEYRKLYDVLVHEKSDAAVMRLGGNFMYLPRLRRDLPALKICVEMNSTIFAESCSQIPFRSHFERLEARQLAKADCVSVVSSYWKDYLTERGVDPAKIFLNPNGVNLERFSPDSVDRATMRNELNIPADAFVVGYVGGMETFRRLPEVVDAIATLRRHGEGNLYLLMAGDGADMESVQQRFADNADSMEGAAACLGWQPHDRVPALMAAMDLAVFPFTAPYCSPLKLFELLAMGVPTIGPDVPSVREVFTPETHLLVAQQDGSDLCNLIRRMKHAPQEAQKLASAGQTHVATKYTWQANAKRVLAALR